MLVLERQVGESIRIGDNVRVEVVRVKGGRVKLGIEAPKHIEVHRSEVYESIRREGWEKA